MVGIVTVIDSSLVQGQLQRALVEDPASWALYADFVDFGALENALNTWKETLAAGAAANMASLTQQMALEAPPAAAQALSDAVQDVSRTLYGNYGGALNIYNLPTSLMAAITASVIPAVSGALARRDRREAPRSLAPLYASPPFWLSQWEWACSSWASLSCGCFLPSSTRIWLVPCCPLWAWLLSLCV